MFICRVRTSEEEQRDPAPFEKLLVKCWISVPLGSLQLELLQGRQKRLELKFKTLETADSPCLCATLAGMRPCLAVFDTGFNATCSAARVATRQLIPLDYAAAVAAVA